MSVKWLIENFHQENGFERLADAVKKQGMECVVAKYLPFESGRYDVFPKDDCVVFQGSIQMARQIQREQSWVPGVWCNWNQMRCSFYYANCGKLLLNQGYMMMPLSEVFRRKEELFEHFGGSFFMRPDSGAKTFTGMLVHFDAFEEKDYKRLFVYEAMGEDLIVVAPPKRIRNEWRVLVADGKAVTGSLYKFNEKLCPKGGLLPVEVNRLAEEVGKVFTPDPLFIADICETTDGKLSLLEVGAFSVAGLYEMDADKIVEAATIAATKEWDDINKI